MSDLEIITTSDGSHTLRNKSLNETYHSIHGAVRESTHVFIRHGLHHFCEQHHPKEVAVLEVGFGTGLNALLTLQYAANNEVNIRYTTLEPFPLTGEVWSNLNYAADEKAQEHFSALHRAEWNCKVSVVAEFTIFKTQATLQEAVFIDMYDVIYFDAFAPSIQPELWNYPALEKVVGVLKKGGVFVTYSAKGQLKRDLRSLGLVVETLDGPPGKNEMVRARREE